jgi:hypothetical protein
MNAHEQFSPFAMPTVVSPASASCIQGFVRRNFGENRFDVAEDTCRAALWWEGDKHAVAILWVIVQHVYQMVQHVDFNTGIRTHRSRE